MKRLWGELDGKNVGETWSYFIVYLYKILKNKEKLKKYETGIKFYVKGPSGSSKVGVRVRIICYNVYLY